MIFGIDYQAAVPTERSGIGTYIFNLVDALSSIDGRNEYNLLVPSMDKSLKAVSENFKYISKKNPFRFIKRFDSFHGPDFKLISVRAGRKIVTIHDLASRVEGDFMSEDFLALTRNKIEKSTDKADVIVTVSKTIKHQLEEYYPRIRGKIRVVYHGIGDEIQRTNQKDLEFEKLGKYGITTPYFLFVGNLETRKNIITLLKAFQSFIQKEKTNHQLVLVGKPGWGYERIMKHVNESACRDRIRFVGWICSADISTLYSNADLFVYPSWYEGFGFPLLEAMKCGVPVIASDIPTHREIAGNAAIFVPPSDAESFAQKFSLLLSDGQLRTGLVQSGKSRSELFTWKKAAQAMLDIYEG
ncbi:MAG: glycosyltransferase family 4 protein [Ignavibacteriales bacterium]|nr:glycosyltransferase family 4 protein [Ignavibacteriales bacterium]